MIGNTRHHHTRHHRGESQQVSTEFLHYSSVFPYQRLLTHTMNGRAGSTALSLLQEFDLQLRAIPARPSLKTSPVKVRAPEPGAPILPALSALDSVGGAVAPAQAMNTRAEFKTDATGQVADVGAVARAEISLEANAGADLRTDAAELALPQKEEPTPMAAAQADAPHEDAEQGREVAEAEAQAERLSLDAAEKARRVAEREVVAAAKDTADEPISTVTVTTEPVVEPVAAEVEPEPEVAAATAVHTDATEAAVEETVEEAEAPAPEVELEEATAPVPEAETPKTAPPTPGASKGPPGMPGAKPGMTKKVRCSARVCSIMSLPLIGTCIGPTLDGSSLLVRIELTVAA
jgi:ribonuclease E